MTEASEDTANQVEKFLDRATALYGAYRQVGWALSSTIIGFATVLLAWGLPPSASSGPVTRSWLSQATLSLVAIAGAFVQQYFYYQGSMKQARALFEPHEKRAKAEHEANRAFSVADTMAGVSCAALILALVASIVLWAVRPEPPSSTKPEAAPGKQSLAEDNWQKMRECSAQVDRLASKDAGKSADISVLGRQSHYNASLNRCLVWESIVNRAAEKERTLPLMYDELSDAFEGKVLATCTGSQTSAAGTFCSVQDKEHFGDCGYCRSFINEHLTK